jgi:RNA ligase (TIGR02306 family)
LTILSETVTLELGDDVSTYIGVSKFEKPISPQLAGQAKGNFPTHLVSKTDEDNLKSNIKVLEELKNCDTIVITEKCDGTSATFIKELDGTFRVCSRNLELKDTEENIYWKMARKYDLYNLMDNGMVIAGEIVGNGIQGNPMKLKDVELFVFNIKNLNDNSYLTYDDMCLKLKHTNINMVKIITKIIGNDVENISLDYLQKLANEQKYGNSPAEGIVIRGYKNNKTVYSQKLQKMLSVKIINQYYKD